MFLNLQRTASRLGTSGSTLPTPSPGTAPTPTFLYDPSRRPSAISIRSGRRESTFVVIGKTVPRRKSKQSNKPINSEAKASNEEMCGLVPSEICRFSELAPGQFGLTKQLVLRIALPHITLLVVSVGYALLGCWIMTVINYSDGVLPLHPNESNGEGALAVRLIIEAKQNFVREFWEEVKGYGNSPMSPVAKSLIITHTNESSPLEMGLNRKRRAALLHRNHYKRREILDEERIRAKNSGRSLFIKFASRLHQIYLQHPKATTLANNIKGSEYIVRPSSPSLNVTWNLFFTTTCLTSIGYGVNAPSSFVGRLFCVLFITFGIPLYLVTLADLAKFCTEGMNRTYTEFIQVKFQIGRWLRRQWKASFHEYDPYLSSSNEIKHVDEVIIAGGEEEVAEFLWTHLEKTKFVEVPFVLVYFILLTYIGSASYLIAYLEEWSLRDGFYFVMMSVLTIGFGDLMPANDKFLLVTLAIILVGLIVTTTCIDIVGAYYIDQLHFFGRRLDVEDPLEWLKAVQQKRIEAMKREAMRKLFEMVTALHHMHFPAIKKLESFNLTNSVQEIQLPDPPKPPRGIVAFHATAESVCLRWDPPVLLDEGKRFWYTLSYKTRTPQRRNHHTVVDFINKTYYEVTGLKSFTLYEFSVVITTRFGSSKPCKCQEYTEPCTVPQLLKLEAISSETATISWKAPRKNNGIENYTLMFAQEPAPQFRFWQRFDIGSRKRFTLTELNNDTRYICCTRSWWYDEEHLVDTQNYSSRRASTAASEGRRKSVANGRPKGYPHHRHSHYLSPPSWRLRRGSSREPLVDEMDEDGEDVDNEHKSSITSSEYQIIS
ncbi:ion channel domain-containing protein [Ditylenchus destructor]|nr:ion channel domain-containing protein [Ditylenchus destructor]